MNFNPLIAIPSPRDLDEIKQNLDKITKYDKLWIKYSPEHVTYPLMRRHFLHHESNHYTHLIIAPDDLLVDQNSVETLLSDYNSLPEGYDPDQTILSGFCNVDTSENVKNANVSNELESIEVQRHKRFYRWMKLEYLRQYARKNPTNPLVPAVFAGFPLIVIPRNVMENIQFRNDSVTGKFDENGCCVDVMFCHDAYQKGYKILVDSRVDLKHLKYSDTSTSALIQQQARTAKDYYYYFEYSKEIRIVG